MSRFRTSGALAVLVWMLLVGVPPARAVDNAALGGIGGIDNGTLQNGDGSGEARVSLFTVDLALIKQARDLTGAVLPDGAGVTPGQELYFVLYVDNPTSVAAGDVALTDLLDESQFTYIAGSIEQTTVRAGSDDATIWAGTWTPLTDALELPDDAASCVDTGGPPGADRLTVGAVPGQANQTVDLPAMSLRAFRFRARVN